MSGQFSVHTNNISYISVEKIRVTVITFMKLQEPILQFTCPILDREVGYAIES